MTKQQKRRKPSTVSRDKAAMWPTVAQAPGTEQRWSATHTWEQPDWTIDDLVEVDLLVHAARQQLVDERDGGHSAHRLVERLAGIGVRRAPRL
mgnify:CR=1 FL=1